MIRFLKFLTTMVVALAVICQIGFSAGDTPIQNLRLTSSANGGGFSFTNLNNIALTGNLYNANHLVASNGMLFSGGNAVVTNASVVLSSIGGLIDTGPVTNSYYWSSDWRKNGRLVNLRAILDSGTLMGNVRVGIWTNLANCVVIYTGLVVSITATSIDLPYNMYDGYCVGFITTNCSSPTNFFLSIGHSQP